VQGHFYVMMFLCKGWCYGDSTASWLPVLIF